jgi:hypothetical protein
MTRISTHDRLFPVAGAAYLIILDSLLSTLDLLINAPIFMSRITPASSRKKVVGILRIL